jgi:hypothetical protein
MTTVEPTTRQLRIMREMRSLELLAANETTHIRADDGAAEQCVDRGWLDPIRPPKYQLTAAGRAVLERYPAS